MLVQEVAQEVAVPQEHASHHKNQKCHISAVYPQELWNARSKKNSNSFVKRTTIVPYFLLKRCLFLSKLNTFPCLNGYLRTR